MAGDFSRSSWNKVKHYSGVLMQQGRVQVDADWNEQLSLQLHRTYVQTNDIIGNCGTTKNGDGFRISTMNIGGMPGDLRIHPGRYYVNGLLCELDPERILVTAVPSAGSQVNLPALSIDDRDIAEGDWVELWAEGYESVVAQVTYVPPAGTANTDINGIAPNYFTITLSQALGSLASAPTLWLWRVTTFTTQPFLLNQWDAALEVSPPSSPINSILTLPHGDYLVVLEAWQREVNALEDSHLREVALGGPDTCERLQTVWQVHVIPYGGEASPPNSPLLSPVSPPSTINCCSDIPGFDVYRSSKITTGLMNAQVSTAAVSSPPCLPISPSGYQGLANQLYRVEIFQSGNYNNTATMVWSRDNAMVETSIVCVDSSNNIYLNDLGKDDLHSFQASDYVEIIDPEGELQGLPRFLATIETVPTTSSVPGCSAGAAPAYPITLSPAPTRFQGKSNLRLRRWDMPQNLPAGETLLTDASGNPQGIQIVPGWITLENGVEVNFTEGFYASGSYWEIPARTATGDIEWPPFEVPNTNPIPQPPIGPLHSFCRLALLTVSDNGREWNPLDCRCTFPSLTNICASDICYHGTGCELESVATVQQALDELAAKSRFHNQMLHGAGVVCGLAVSCPGKSLSSTAVNVATGYAIDCDGYDLIVERATSVDLATLLPLSPQNDELADGDYELILERADGLGEIDGLRDLKVNVESGDSSCCSKTVRTQTTPNACVTFRAIKCAKQSFSEQIFGGTVLADFYNDCLKPLLDKFKNRYGNSYVSSDKQVSEEQALVSSLTNLFIQLIQPSLTRDVYISKSEADILKRFYEWLRDQLSDRTFCALSSGLRECPEYKLTSPMETIFGKGFKTRMRVDPTGERAYTVGIGPDIHVYDLSTQQLAAVVTLPIPGNSSGWTVQDVGFSSNGSQIYAIATGVNSITGSFDSLFAVGTASSFTVNWKANGSLGPLPFLTLAVVATPTTPNVYATVQSQGIFLITFSNTTVGAATSIASVNTVGHLVAAEGYLFATVNGGTAAAGSFDQVQRYAAGTASPTPVVYALNGPTGNLTDDLACLVFNQAGVQGEPGLVVSALNPSTSTKELLYFQSFQALNSHDLAENTTVRLAINPATEIGNAIVTVSLEDSCRLLQVSLVASGTVAYAPVEVHPTSIALATPSPSMSYLYVLNSTSNTISQIPSTMPTFTDYTDLEEYRTAALEAYMDLFVALLQDLKDCFCNLLLPDCPSCDLDAEEGRGVALACITVRNGALYKICNLEKRKYVKTFPTVGYWLSLVPIIPFIKTLVQNFCCYVIPEFWGKRTAPETDKEAISQDFTATSGENIRYAVAKVSGLKASDLSAAVTQKATPVSKLAIDAFASAFKPSTAATVKVNQVTGMSISQAKTALNAAGVNVATTAAYDPSALATNLAAYASAPTSVPAGSSVTLVVDSNQQVRYYIPTPPEVDSIQKQVSTVVQAGQQTQDRLTADEKLDAPALANIQSLQNLVATLQSQITSMQTSQASQLAARDQQIAALTVSAQDLANQVKTIQSQLPSPPAKG